MAMIEAYGLTRKFGNLTALEDLSLQVEGGEVLGFLGPNGAGKTTAIRILSGIISPTSGYATVAGLRTDREVEHLHEVIGLLPESPGFYDRLTAARNLEFFAGFYPNLDIGAQVEKYLKAVGLWERRCHRVGTFSKGMKQRLALARTLIHDPRVLFLDEPTAGLDPEAATEVRNLIQSLSGRGCTIFLSTHNLSEAEFLCHRIAIIRTRLLALGTPDGLRERLFPPQLVVRLEAVDDSILEAVKSLGFVRGLSQVETRLLIEMADPEQNRPDLVKRVVEAGGRVLEVSEERQSLEEVYLSLVRQDGPRD